MASRSPRVFSAQFHLLLVTSQLEEAEERHRQAEADGHRLRAWRAARDLAHLWDAVESQRRRLEPPAWRVADAHPTRTGLEPQELLHSRLKSYVQFDSASPAPAAAPPSTPAGVVAAAVAPTPAPVVAAPAPTLQAAPAAVAGERRERRSLTPHLQKLFALGSLASIGVTAAEIAAHGIGQQPALIAAELCALVLAPFAILLGSDR